jgi:hypothetical protein
VIKTAEEGRGDSMDIVVGTALFLLGVGGCSALLLLTRPAWFCGLIALAAIGNGVFGSVTGRITVYGRFRQKIFSGAMARVPGVLHIAFGAGILALLRFQ